MTNIINPRRIKTDINTASMAGFKCPCCLANGWTKKQHKKFHNRSIRRRMKQNHNIGE